MTATTLRIGLTGGIGSGKTAVSDAFAALGLPVVDADVLAHEVTRAGHPALEKIVAAFGPRALDAGGNLDRAFMRDAVFRDPAKRKRLEGILHPVIRERMEADIDACDAPYCIVVIPLLVESGDTSRVDRVLVVDAPDDRRRDWIRRRSGLDDDQIDRILQAQATREQRLAVADDVIVNDGDLADLRTRVAALHRDYLRLAARIGQGT